MDSRKTNSLLYVGILLSLAAVSSAAQAQRHLPSDGNILFFAGQTSPDLSAFRTGVLAKDEEFRRPDGVTLYTDIGTGCNGTTGRCNLGGSGNIMDFPATLGEYPNAALAVGLYLSDSPGCGNQPLRALAERDDEDEDLGNGVGEGYRERLDTLINYLQDTGRDVFLRIGYEFDGEWNCYNTGYYIEAFRYVKGRIDALEADNVATVWQSATYPINGSADANYDASSQDHFTTWYPGDDYVDWVGISTFYFEDSGTHQHRCSTLSSQPEALYGRAVSFASSRSKPVFISESAPQGYQTDDLSASCVDGNNPTTVTAEDIWDQWYEDYFEFISSNSSTIRAYSYINSDWEAISQFNCPAGQNCDEGYWGDSRIQNNDTILSRFKSAVASNGSSTEAAGSDEDEETDTAGGSDEDGESQSTLLDTTATLDEQACPNGDDARGPDLDGDGISDACDADDDGDRVRDNADNCPLLANQGQEDDDQFGAGTACDADSDMDGVRDVADRCLNTAVASVANAEGCDIGQVAAIDVEEERCLDDIRDDFVSQGLVSEREATRLLARVRSADVTDSSCEERREAE